MNHEGHEGHGDRKRQKGFTTEAQRAQRPGEKRERITRTSGLVDVTLRYQSPGFLETPARAYATRLNSLRNRKPGSRSRTL